MYQVQQYSFTLFFRAFLVAYLHFIYVRMLTSRVKSRTILRRQLGGVLWQTNSAEGDHHDDVAIPQLTGASCIILYYFV